MPPEDADLVRLTAKRRPHDRLNDVHMMGIYQRGVKTSKPVCWLRFEPYEIGAESISVSLHRVLTGTVVTFTVIRP